MNPDKTYTYDPKWNFTVTHGNHYAEHKDSTDAWTHGAVFGHSHIGASLPGSDMPREVKPLAFFWWLNPWKHMELLFDAYKAHAEVANEWRDRYHQDEKLWKAAAAERDEATECIRDELDTTKAERDAANQAVRFLRNQRKKPSRK